MGPAELVERPLVVLFLPGGAHRAADGWAVAVAKPELQAAQVEPVERVEVALVEVLAVSNAHRAGSVSFGMAACPELTNALQALQRGRWSSSP